MSEAQRSEASDSTVRLERMARKAGWSGIYTQWVSPTERESMTVPVTPEQVKKFAELIAAEERKAIFALAASQGWAMKNEDPFEDAVRDICTMRSNVEFSGTPAALSPEAPLERRVGPGAQED